MFQHSGTGHLDNFLIQARELNSSAQGHPGPASEGVWNSLAQPAHDQLVIRVRGLASHLFSHHGQLLDIWSDTVCLFVTIDYLVLLLILLAIDAILRAINI